jgi:hypothetical protein
LPLPACPSLLPPAACCCPTPVQHPTSCCPASAACQPASSPPQPARSPARQLTGPSSALHLRRELEGRAKEYQISDTLSFYESDMFKGSGFALDTQRLNITFAMV